MEFTLWTNIGMTRTLKQTQRLKGRVTRTMRVSQDRMRTRVRTNMKINMRGTLKQTQRLKGRVTRTMIQDMAVKSQPQMPIPSSASSAETLRF